MLTDREALDLIRHLDKECRARMDEQPTSMMAYYLAASSFLRHVRAVLAETGSVTAALLTLDLDPDIVERFPVSND